MYDDGVRCTLTGEVLRVLDERVGIGVLSCEVLVYVASQNLRHELHTPTDAKHGYLTLVGAAYEGYLCLITLGVDAVELWYGLLTEEYGIDIGSAT